MNHDTKTIPFIPENAPFNNEQRLWLNGYVAGLLAGKNYSAAHQNDSEKNSPALPLLILFGSQTGTAEKLAKQIAKESKSHSCHSRVLDAAEHAKIDWSKETHLLIVTSTYGDGDMPDNAQAFWDWLHTDDAKALAHLNYSVLALGDTNYEHFCGAGKKMDAQLESLGAKRIHPLAECDLDYEAKVKAWTNEVWAKLDQPAVNHQPSVASANGHHVIAADNQLLTTDKFSYNKSNPFPARLLRNVLLNNPGSQKEVRHYEISLDGSGITYEAGDALGVLPVNCPELVDEIVAALQCDPAGNVTVGDSTLPLREALLRHLDLTKPSQEFFAAVANVAPSNGLTELLALEKRNELKEWLYGRGVIDLLLLLPEPPTAADFVKLMKKLTPRLYSISSSPKAHSGEVHLTVSAVRYDSFGRGRKGVASTFLADRVGDADVVKIFVQPSAGFKLPPSGDTPIIMVGPGTGIAPFRAFLHERRAMGATGKNWLFFGEQQAATDFYYRDELEKMFSDGHLTKLSTAFSRDQAEKIYVQHRMQESAAELWSWLESGAHVYVCGDASRMAKDVEETLHKVIQAAGGKNADDARAYVAKMKVEKRYQRDVY